MRRLLLSIAFLAVSSVALADQTAKQEKAFNDMRELLVGCDISYKTDSVRLDNEYSRRYLDLLSQSSRTIPESEKYKLRMDVEQDFAKKPSEYQKCVKEAKADVGGKARLFSTFFKANQQQKAKRVLAFWMTALGATGDRNFDDALTKFDDAVNDLRVEAMVGSGK
ncbi:hypothetical protein [Rugamonas sp.]|uniref:hypothetical protein n=1 Tax=Rugamonas sp. TaxID=1926287 RepID=UPI0025D8A3EA|nr:hypothetical protein [Rugamonas sp.]